MILHELTVQKSQHRYHKYHEHFAFHHGKKEFHYMEVS